MKQTAVEWLVEQVNSDCLNSTFIQPKLIEQAKEIEKEQMLGFYLDRIYAHKELQEEFEQYYKEKYNK